MHTSVISLGRTGLEMNMVVHKYFRTVWLISMHLLNTAGQYDFSYDNMIFFPTIKNKQSLFPSWKNSEWTEYHVKWQFCMKKGGCVLGFCVLKQKTRNSSQQKKAKLLIHIFF